MHSEKNTANIELAVGICGHRWVRESPELQAATDKVVEKIERHYSVQGIRLLSPLAEGADRIVAKRILSFPKVYLVALLPFPVKEYLMDFSGPESVEEFRDLFGRANQVIELPGQQNREQAYVSLAKTLLDQCDVLIGVWDGKPANGRGGTAEIVQEARRRGMPLAWILHGKPDARIRKMIANEEAMSDIVFERFPMDKSKPEPEN